MGNTIATELPGKLHQSIEIIGYLITTKHTSTKNGDRMHFGTFFDFEGQVFDTTHFPDTSRKHPFRGKGFYRIRGKVAEDFGYPMIEVHWMEKLPMVEKYDTFNTSTDYRVMKKLQTRSGSSIKSKSRFTV